MKVSGALLLSSLLGISTLYAEAQFACTLSGAKDEDSCFEVSDDDGSTCVWCALSSFAFCVSESQAETMEQSLPTVECDRKGHDKNTTDDDDDYIAPNDDSIPDDFWTCLQQKDTKSCHNKHYNCTWCDTKGGFGLCMSGPAAESAKKSDWFQCDKEDLEDISVDGTLIVEAEDPYDLACLASFLKDPSKETCSAATDGKGLPCKYCTLEDAGLSLCLTIDQATIGEESLGMTCDDDDGGFGDAVEDPLDTACLLAYLQDQSKDACLAAKDSDGNACEFCTLQGSLSVCVNEDQAAIAEQVGATCDDEEHVGEFNDSAPLGAAEPLDPACLLAYVQDQSKEACLAAVDHYGNKCEFCSVPGAFDVCVNQDQAAVVEQVGGTCGDTDADAVELVEDPMDTSCLMAYLQDQSKDSCSAAVDRDGNTCEFCSVSGAFDLCVNGDQAAIAEQVGATCDSKDSGAPDLALEGQFDSACLAAYLEDKSKDACLASADKDGNPCEFCSVPGAFDVCVNGDQAAIAERAGATCSSSGDVALHVQDPLDTACMIAFLQDQDENSCLAAADSDGNACQFCSLQGSLNLCVNEEQAVIAQRIGATCEVAVFEEASVA